MTNGWGGDAAYLGALFGKWRREVIYALSPIPYFMDSGRLCLRPLKSPMRVRRVAQGVGDGESDPSLLGGPGSKIDLLGVRAYKCGVGGCVGGVVVVGGRWGIRRTRF